MTLMQNPAAKYSPKCLYLIQNKYSGLVMELHRKDNEQGSLIRASEPDQQNVYQLWMFDQVQKGNLEIINCISCLVITDDQPDAVLHFPRQKSSQLWKLKPCTIYPNEEYYWFLRSNNNDKALKLDGNLTCADYDLNNENMIFRMVPVNQNREVLESVFLRSSLSGKVVDVPAASTIKGEPIIQYRQNYRFNQRWRLVKTLSGYLIQNMRSKLYLDIEGESNKPGTRVVQWICSPTGFPMKLNQIWTLQNKGSNLYLIRSVMNNSLILAVEQCSIKDEAKIVTGSYKINYLWAIQGQLPP